MELQLDINKRYSYADYLTWMDDVRRELIDGFINLMTPAPSVKHQWLLGNLYRILSSHLLKKKCKVFLSPFDVRLPKNGKKDEKSIYTIVQPDLCIICDPNKLDEKGCIGSPDMIIEITSPNNSKHDLQVKYQLYEKHGVREYWIVFPYEQTIFVHLLDETGKYKNIGAFAQDDKVKVNILDDFYVDLAEAFWE